MSDTDFNDLAKARGLAAVKSIVDSALHGATRAADFVLPQSASNAPRTLADFEKLIDEADNIDFLSDTLLRMIAREKSLGRIKVDILLGKVAKRIGSTKKLVEDEFERHCYGDGDAGEASNDEVIERLNQKHAVVQWEGSTMIAGFETCPITGGRRVSYAGRRDFELRYLNQKIMHAGEEFSIAEYWLNHPARKQYDSTVFFPGRPQEECGRYLNLWNGWQVEPVKGDCSAYLGFVAEYICSGDDELYDYLMNWLAHMLQRPMEIAETSITLRGGQGLGKNTFIEPIMRIIGLDHAIEVSNGNHVTGKFNAHLENVLLLFNNEASWGGDRAAAGSLKALVTDKRGLVERKGKDAKPSQNFKRLITASNNLWPTAVELEDRRNVIIDVNPNKAPPELFAILRAMCENKLNPSLKALFFYLLHERDLSGWHPRMIPDRLKKNGRELALETEQSPYRWWDTILKDRFIFKDSEAYSDDRSSVWPDHVQTTVMHNVYLAWCKKMSITHPESDSMFGAAMKRCGLSRTRPRDAAGGRYNAYKIPSHVDCVKDWCRRYSFNLDNYLDEDEL